MRAVDTSSAVTGNLALRAATIAPADAAIEEAIAALFERRDIADPELDLPAQGYAASRLPGEDARGVPAALQSVAAYPAGAPELPAGDGIVLRYLIERLCVRAGPATTANCALVPQSMVAAVPAAGYPSQPPPVPCYRITVRVDGPQRTVTLVQATVRGTSPPARMSWRMLMD